MKFMSFIAWWLFTVAGTFLVLSLFGLVPTEIKELNATVLSFFSGVAPASLSVGPVAVSTNTAAKDSGALNSATSTAPISEAVLPTRIIIAKIGVNTAVSNPESRDETVLNTALLTGAVRYPGSGTLEDNANMYIFAHSSGLPVVHNQAFKSFNRLGELQLGDDIIVYSSTRMYRYKIISVAVATASDALVTFEKGKRTLTLSTCDTFGKKSDRFVVEAAFIEDVSLTDV